MAKRLDKLALIEQLDRIRYEKEGDGEQEQVGRLNLGGHLLLLAELDHEHQYDLCRRLALHLLETVPEPDDFDLEDE